MLTGIQLLGPNHFQKAPEGKSHVSGSRPGARFASTQVSGDKSTFLRVDGPPIKEDLMQLLARLEAPEVGFKLEWTESGDGQPVFIPSTGELVGRLKETPLEELDGIISRSEDAGKELKTLPLTQIADFLLNLARHIEKNRADIERLITCLNKSAKEAAVEVHECLDVLKLNAASIHQPRAQLFQQGAQDQLIQKRWFPLGDTSLQLGVCNFMLSIIAKHVGPANIAQTAQVVKVSDTGGAPITLFLKHLYDKAAEESGVPKDAFIPVVTSREVSGEMIRNDRFKVIAATGGEQMVLAVRTAAAETGARTILEGTGHNIVIGAIPADKLRTDIFFRDLAGSMLGMGALRCTTLHTGIMFDRVGVREMASVARYAIQGSFGDPRHPATVGLPLFSRGHLEQFNASVQAAHDAGGQPVELPTLGVPDEFGGGYWPQPSLMSFDQPSDKIGPYYGPAWNVVVMDPSELDKVFDFLEKQKLGLANSSYLPNECDERFLESTRSGVANLRTPPNGNPVGAGGFNPGTPASGGPDSTAASYDAWKDYSIVRTSREKVWPVGSDLSRSFLFGGRRHASTLASEGAEAAYTGMGRVRRVVRSSTHVAPSGATRAGLFFMRLARTVAK